jgi:hypothetical protein
MKESSSCSASARPCLFSNSVAPVVVGASLGRST